MKVAFVSQKCLKRKLMNVGFLCVLLLSFLPRSIPVSAQSEAEPLPANLDIKKKHFYDTLTLFFQEYEEGTIPGGLTLIESLKIAEENSNDLQISESKSRAAADKIEEVKSAQNPQLNASGYYSKQGPIPVFNIPIPGFSSVRIINDTNYDLKLTASYLISNFGLLENARKIACLSYLQSRVAESRVRSDLHLGVIKDFFTLVETKGFVSVAKRAISAKELQLGIAKANFEEGIFPRFEVIQASVGLKNAQLEVIKAAKGMELVKAQMRKTLGLKQSIELDVRRPRFILNPTPPIEQSIETAYKCRPELTEMDIAVDVAHANIDLAYNGKNPTLLLVGSYDQMTESFGRTPSSWNVAFNFEFPIFDGGETWAKVKQAKEALTQIELSRDQLRRDISLQVKSAHLDVQESLQKLEYAEANLEQAQQGYDIALIRYQEGIGTNLELDNALVGYLNANASILSAYCEYQRSWAALVYSMGLSLKGVYYDQGTGDKK